MRGLSQAQRGGEVREPAQATAGCSQALREAGDELPGDGGHRRANDLVVHEDNQTCPNERPSPFVFPRLCFSDWESGKDGWYYGEVLNCLKAYI